MTYYFIFFDSVSLFKSPNAHKPQQNSNNPTSPKASPPPRRNKREKWVKNKNESIEKDGRRPDMECRRVVDSAPACVVRVLSVTETLQRHSTNTITPDYYRCIRRQRSPFLIIHLMCAYVSIYIIDVQTMSLQITVDLFQSCCDWTVFWRFLLFFFVYVCLLRTNPVTSAGTRVPIHFLDVLAPRERETIND